MKALWSCALALIVLVCGCEKRKGTLLPPRDAANKGAASVAAPAAHSGHQEMRAKSLPEGMVEGEVREPATPSLNGEPTEDLQKVKQEALERIKKHPGEKVAGSNARSKAAALYQRGRQLVAQGDFDEGQEYYLVACQLGDSEGCHKFGWHEERSGNFSNARQFYKIACEAGLSKSCNNLGFRLEKQQHWDEALDFYARACLEKHSVGCENLKRLRDERLKMR